MRAVKEHVVEVAHELFARRGIDGVSLSEIATAAGTSKANVVHHFGTKDGLYAACLAQIRDRLLDVVAEAERHDDHADGVRVELERWAAAWPADLRVMTYGLLRLPERPGPWALAEPVMALARLLGDEEPSAAAITDLLGLVTYRELARPLTASRQADPNDTDRPRTPAGRQP